jgi:phosphoribosylformylglycinamidine (FGAM) synthase PurS component
LKIRCYKKGMDFIISEFSEVIMTKSEEIEFGKIIKIASDNKKQELSKEEIIKIYQKFLTKLIY